MSNPSLIDHFTDIATHSERSDWQTFSTPTHRWRASPDARAAGGAQEVTAAAGAGPQPLVSRPSVRVERWQANYQYRPPAAVRLGHQSHVHQGCGGEPLKSQQRRGQLRRPPHRQAAQHLLQEEVGWTGSGQDWRQPRVSLGRR